MNESVAAIQSIGATAMRHAFISHNNNSTYLLRKFNIKMQNNIKLQLSDTGEKVVEATLQVAHIPKLCKSSYRTFSFKFTLLLNIVTVSLFSFV